MLSRALRLFICYASSVPDDDDKMRFMRTVNRTESAHLWSVRRNLWSSVMQRLEFPKGGAGIFRFATKRNSAAMRISGFLNTGVAGRKHAAKIITYCIKSKKTKIQQAR
jgi:hypothetical protein